MTQDRSKQLRANTVAGPAMKHTAEQVGGPKPTPNDRSEQTAALVKILAMGQTDIEAGRYCDADEFFKEFGLDENP